MGGASWLPEGPSEPTRVDGYVLSSSRLIWKINRPKCDGDRYLPLLQLIVLDPNLLSKSTHSSQAHVGAIWPNEGSPIISITRIGKYTLLRGRIFVEVHIT